MRRNYGNDGYSTWFILLEQLGKTDYHYLNYADEMERMNLRLECDITEEKLTNILTDLAIMGSIDRELFEKYQVIWSQKFFESIEHVYVKRRNPPPDREFILQLLAISDSQNSISDSQNTLDPVLPPLEVDVNTQSKVDYTKVEKSRVKKKGAILPFNSPEFKLIWEKWKTYKKEQFRFTYKSEISEQSALKKLFKISEEKEFRAAEILEEAMSNGWQGFFALKGQVNGAPVKSNFRKLIDAEMKSRLPKIDEDGNQLD